MQLDDGEALPSVVSFWESLTSEQETSILGIVSGCSELSNIRLQRSDTTTHRIVAERNDGPCPTGKEPSKQEDM